MLDRCLRETRSEGRDVKMMGGAHACRGVLVSAGGYARPPAMQKTTGGAESSPVMDVLAGLSVVLVHGEDNGQSMGASVCTQIAAVNAKMAWCNRPRNR